MITTQDGNNSQEIDVAAAVAAAEAGFDFGDFEFGSVSSGSGSSGPPKSYYDALGDAATSRAKTAADTLSLQGDKYTLDATKLAEQIRLDREAVGRKYVGAEQRLAALQGLQSAGMKDGKVIVNPELSGSLDAQKENREGYVDTQFTNLLGQLNKLYYGEGGSVAAPTAESSLGLTNTGYQALRDFLQSSAGTRNAFATAPRATAAPVSNDISQYMKSQGVDANRAQPGLLAARASLEGGASNYNSLLTTLATASTEAQQSRLAEQQMGQTLARAQLGAQRDQQEGTLTSAKLQALNTISEQYESAKFQLQQAAVARDQALSDAIAELKGGGYILTDEEKAEDAKEKAEAAKKKKEEDAKTDKKDDTPVVAQTRAQKIAAAPTTYATFKEAAKVLSPKAVAKYTADGSGLSAKEVASLKKDFPALAKVFEQVKKKK
jgi:hypothetical protein